MQQKYISHKINLAMSGRYCRGPLYFNKTGYCVYCRARRTKLGNLKHCLVTPSGELIVNFPIYHQISSLIQRYRIAIKM